jgi:Family of unknown function (DUF5670)
MQSYINVLAPALFIIWIVEFFGYNGGPNTHILLLLSIILVLVKAFVLSPVKERA